jgi:hypothetical protein
VIPVELERALEGVRQRIRRMIEIRRYEPLSELDEDVFRDLLDREEQLLRLARQYPDWLNDPPPVAMPEAM